MDDSPTPGDHRSLWTTNNVYADAQSMQVPRVSASGSYDPLLDTSEGSGGYSSMEGLYMGDVRNSQATKSGPTQTPGHVGQTQPSYGVVTAPGYPSPAFESTVPMDITPLLDLETPSHMESVGTIWNPGNLTQQWMGYGGGGDRYEFSRAENQAMWLTGMVQSQQARIDALTLDVMELRSIVFEQKTQLQHQEVTIQRLTTHLPTKKVRKMLALFPGTTLTAIRNKCLDVMGCTERVLDSDEPSSLSFYKLPARPPAGEDMPVAPDGVSKLCIPDWDKNISDPANVEYIRVAVATIRQTLGSVLDPEKHTEDALKEVVTSFRANDMRKAIVIFRKYVGYANSVGVDTVVHTDWEDVEESDTEDEAGRMERTRLRDAAGLSGDSKALEQRTTLWPSLTIRRICAALRGIRAAMPAKMPHNAAPSLLNPVDNGINYTPEEREKVLKIVQQNASMFSGKVGTTARFRGRDDETMRLGALQKSVIYKEFISDVWVKRTPAHQTFRDHAPNIPTYMTVLSAVVPDEFFTPSDRAALEHLKALAQCEDGPLLLWSKQMTTPRH
ncbi:hypothetical protein C8Q79DRAFT_1008223 [Trametes meyenii]|nr:hypothetical protein C8Q79DRAFT_1008223 [Trametes meyenii]